MQWWKVLGVAAFVGVAATGVLVARTERRHQDYSPEEIRDRLHARAAEALAGEPADGALPDLLGPDDLDETSGEIDDAAPEAPAAPTNPLRRLGVRLNHVRTRLGVRPLPTRRRR